jgi:hypothetical protein
VVEAAAAEAEAEDMVVVVAAAWVADTPVAWVEASVSRGAVASLGAGSAAA